MIHATADGSYTKQQGDHGRAASASSTPASTGRTPTSRRTSTARCRATSPPTSRRRRRPSTDRASTPSCVDPPNVDDNGHGTHVAGDDRRGAQRARHRRRRAEGDARQHPGGPGLRLLLPAADGRRADLRRRQRHRRRQHELLHRPLAVQLHGQPGRLARRSRPSSGRSSRRRSARSTTRTSTASRWSRRPATSPPTSTKSTADDTSPDYPARRRRTRGQSTTRA